MVTITIEDLSFRYRSSPVLTDVNVDLGSSKILGLLGPNGSGKSTLLKCINQILKPKGRVIMDGEMIQNLSTPDIARRIGYVPQSELMGMSMTVFDAVLMGRRVHMGWKPAPHDLDLVSSVLREMSIESLALEDIWELSGGQRQKVFIARALAQEPDLLLLDEPTSSLDLRHQLETMDEIRLLVRRLGVSVIMAIHDINLAARYADTIAMISSGTISRIGDPLEILTPDTIRDVYGVESDFFYDRFGIPIVVPIRAIDPDSPSPVP